MNHGSPARYTHGHSRAVLSSHASRTAENSAAYLLPHLCEGQALLDVVVAGQPSQSAWQSMSPPGRVVALDAAERPDSARATLEAQGSPQVELTIGDALALPYPDDTFDVVHAPPGAAAPSLILSAALAEMRRVTKPGGLVAVRDAIYSAMTWYPQPDGMEAWRRVYLATARANGGEPDAGSRLLAWCRAAGFTDISCSADTWCYATPELRSWWGEMWAERSRDLFRPADRGAGTGNPG